MGIAELFEKGTMTVLDNPKETAKVYKYIAVCNSYLCGEYTRTSYGIAYVCICDGTVTVLQSIQDISNDRQRVENLAELCSELDLNPIHLNDVVDDFLSEA